MFNRTISDDWGAIREIENRAVERARVPGVAAVGNAAGAYSVVTSGLTPANPNQPNLPDEHFGGSGTDINGNAFAPFLLDVDTMDNAAFYLG